MNAIDTTASQSNSPHRKARKWRALIILVGFVLTSTFFMPAIKACNSPVVPAEHFIGIIDEGPDNNTVDGILLFIAALCVYLPAYLLGLLLAIGALFRLLGKKGLNRYTNVFMVTLLVFVSEIALTNATLFLTDEWPIDLGEFIRGIDDMDWWFCLWNYFIGHIWVLIYLFFTRKVKRSAYLCHAFITCMMLSIWFAFWFLGGLSDKTSLYGIYISFFSSCMLWISVVGEARALSGHSWLRTLWKLFSCSIKDVVEFPGHCPACGYFLYGLTEQRCPECGRGFRFEEVGVGPEELGFAGVAEAEQGASLTKPAHPL